MLSTVTKDHASGDAYLNLACPVCGCLPVPHLKHDRYFIDRCPDCDFIYVRNVPAEESRTAASGHRLRGQLRGYARACSEIWEIGCTQEMSSGMHRDAAACCKSALPANTCCRRFAPPENSTTRASASQKPRCQNRRACSSLTARDRLVHWLTLRQTHEGSNPSSGQRHRVLLANGQVRQCRMAQWNFLDRR